MPNIIRHFASNANIRGDFSSTYTKPPFRALHSPLSKSTTPAAASVHPPRAKLTTPAAASVHPPSPSFPASIAVVHHSPSPNLPHLPEADVYSPSPNVSHLPEADVYSPSPDISHLPEADVYSPSPDISHLPEADVYSPSPFMERGGPTGLGRGLPLAIIPRQHCGRLCLIGQSLTRYHHDVFVIDGASRNHLIRRSLEFIPADDYFLDRVIGFPLEFTCIESITSQFEQYVHRELIVSYRQKTKN